MTYNPTYKHLESKIRISGLTLGQWAQLTGCVLFALLFAFQVSPLATGPTITVSVFIAGLPVAASYALAGSEFSATRLIVSVWRWQRRPRRFVAGPGDVGDGYVVIAPPEPEVAPVSPNGAGELRLEAVWDD
jgi:hypothetical protein